MSYRIQRTPRSNPKVVHVDRLKPYLGPPLENWIPQQEGKKTPKGKVEGHKEGMVTRGITSKEVSRKEATGRTARAEMMDSGMRKNGPVKRTVQAHGSEIPVGLTGKEPVTKTDDSSRPKGTIRPLKRFGEWVSSLRAKAPI